MARFPGAIWKPITAGKGRQKLTVFNRMNLHVAVSEAASLHSFFNVSGRVDSHFYVRKDGTVEQYVDTSMRAFADLEGNDATISVETQGGVKNANSEPWTGPQIQALVELFVWAHKTHGIPLRQALNSHLGSSSQGLSWHRLGIDGNFPTTGILRGRNQRGGGMYYSRSRGKICPGDAKIMQIPQILELATDMVLAGNSKPRPKPPKPKKLTADGYWGKATTRQLQRVLGMKTIDGIVSSQSVHWRAQNPGLTGGWDWKRAPKGSLTIAALQRLLKVKDDGLIGPATIKKLQQRLGTPADGKFSKQSRAIIALQNRLNEGKI